MDYFYSPPDHIVNNAVHIDGEEFAHLTHVMRKKEGDEICVVDGRGHAYDVRLITINKKQAEGVIIASRAGDHEPAISVTLAAGILKNPSKFDFLVEKTTELGVKEIIPLTTDRTIPDHAKTDRWQKLALAAMKQSGRSYLPVVKDLQSLDDVLDGKNSFDLKLIAHEKEMQSPATAQLREKAYRSVLILIGPEGGFSDEEVKQCMKAGCIPFYLGERRLRTETAAIVATALTIR